MALKVPEGLSSTKRAKTHLMRATLPSTAAMLSDLRSILVSQISQHAKDSATELFDATRVKALAQLAQTLVLLEKQTSDEHAKVSDMMEDLSPEEVASLEAEARKLLP